MRSCAERMRSKYSYVLATRHKGEEPGRDPRRMYNTTHSTETQTSFLIPRRSRRNSSASAPDPFIDAFFPAAHCIFKF